MNLIQFIKRISIAYYQIEFVSSIHEMLRKRKFKKDITQHP